MSDIKTPYLNGHMYEFDLCWLVEKILSFESQLNQAIDLKTIHYADPIQWDITTQYAPNTVVVDPKTGTAYMSKVPVPAGILLTNTDYWTVIFNYQDIYTKIMEGVAFYNGQTDYASKALLVNDLVWYGLDLYRVTRAIEEGGKLIPGTNLVKTSIESLLSNYYGRDRVATLLNDTLNISGDYTINAGDIAETATDIVTKATSIELDATNTIVTKADSIELNVNDNIATKATSMELNATDNFIIKNGERTIDLKNEMLVNIEDYGAIGDGISDCTEAFKKAAEKGVVTGSNDRTYYISENIDSRHGVFNLNLKMKWNTDLRLYSNSFAINCNLTGDLDGIKTGATEGKQLILVFDADNVIISGCTLDTNVTGIFINNGKNVIVADTIIKNMYYKSPTQLGGYGIIVSNASQDIIISNCIFNNVHRHSVYISVGTPYTLDQICKNISVTGCIMDLSTRNNGEIPYYSAGFNYAINLRPCKNINIKGCTIIDYDGIVATGKGTGGDDSITGTIDQLSVNDCYADVAKSTRNAFSLDTVPDAVICNCIILAGASVISSTDGFKFINNVTTFGGVGISPGKGDFLIKNNSLTDRGNNYLFEFNSPDSLFIVDSNTIKVGGFMRSGISPQLLTLCHNIFNTAYSINMTGTLNVTGNVSTNGTTSTAVAATVNNKFDFIYTPAAT